MISAPLRKFLVILLSLATLFQSTGLVGGLLDNKFLYSFNIQLDLEGDTDKEYEKLKIDNIIRDTEKDQVFFYKKKSDFLGHNNPFYLYVFEIPIPPPEFS